MVPPTRREGRRRTACYSAGAGHGGRRGGAGIIYIQAGPRPAPACNVLARALGASQRNSGGVAFGGASPLCDGVKYKQGKWPRAVRHEGDGYLRAARPCQVARLGFGLDLGSPSPIPAGGRGRRLVGWLVRRARLRPARVHLAGGIDAVLNYFRELFAVYTGRRQ